MMDDDRTLPPGFSQGSATFNPSMRLYYNIRTNKCQYNHGPDINDCAPEPQYRITSETESNTITTQSSYYVAADALLGPVGLKDGSQKDSASEIPKKKPDAESIKGRNDSSVEIPSGPEIKHKATDNRVTLPMHIYFDNLSTGKDKRNIIYLKDHATLFIDLRGKLDIANLSSFLSSRELPPRSVRKIQITHYVMECADAEDCAVPTPATTTIYFHDGSMSMYCSFAHVYDSTCVCDVKRSLESLFRLKHQASRKQVVPTRDSTLTETSITRLLRNFINLLQPQLGSDPNEPSTLYGMEIREYSVCTSENFDPLVDTHCPRRSFHMSGWEEGVLVEISGVGMESAERSYHQT